ncbi:MAG: serine protease [Pseudomonadales bacterium]|nr:serine protease [Pseudomonadales bacterium]
MSARSVVKVRCELPGGEQINSSGFAWPDEEHVVATLHAVAGCRLLIVANESGTAQSFATLGNVNLEGDLALLDLAQPLGITPLRHVEAVPADLRRPYHLWGYPQNLQRILRVDARFGEGLRSVMPLGEAFAGLRGFEDFFTDRTYPKPSAQVLRVTSTFNPGHSGAPILDAEGRVVAIADGTLLGGFRDLNWSIPAHIYLPQLAARSDPKPTTAQRSDLLVGAYTPSTEQSLTVPEQEGHEEISLVLVRTIALARFEQLRREAGEEDPNIDYIRSVVRPEDFARLAFDIYVDEVTGATLAVPSVVDVYWDEAEGLLAAETESGAVAMLIGVLEADDFEGALTHAAADFVEMVVDLAEWTGSSPLDAAFTEVDEAYAKASTASFYEGFDPETGEPVDLNLSMTVSGNQLLGYGVYGPDDLDVLPAEDVVAYLLMQMAVQDLSGFSATADAARSFSGLAP